MKPDKVKKGMMDAGLISFYFFTCFAVFMMLKKLVLFKYNISFYGWSTAFIGALAIGKVVYFLYKSPAEKWLQHLKPIYEILLKVSSYTVLVYLVSILEKSIRFFIEDSLSGTWSSHIFGNGKEAMLLAHAIYVYFCFAGFFTNLSSNSGYYSFFSGNVW